MKKIKQGQELSEEELLSHVFTKNQINQFLKDVFYLKFENIAFTDRHIAFVDKFIFEDLSVIRIDNYQAIRLIDFRKLPSLAVVKLKKTDKSRN